MMSEATITQSRVEFLIDAARRSGLGREVIPIEAIAGWPHLILRGKPEKKVVLSIPFMTSWGVSVGNTMLFAPTHVFQLEWETGKLVRYFRPESEELWSAELLESPIATFPHESLRAMTVSDYRALRQEAYEGYAQVAKAMASGGHISKTGVERFREVMRQLVEPSMEPFYRKMGPIFFDRFLPKSDDETPGKG